MTTQSSPSSNEDRWRIRRRYARVSVAIPVEIYTKSTVGPPLIGQMHNLSVGGVLVSCRESFDLHTELAILFQLPTGPQIQAFGRVIYSTPQKYFGVAFVDLDQNAQVHLQEFTRKTLGYSRRSSRVPYRSHLTIFAEGTAGSHNEESADSVLISRNGGLLVCRATYKEGQEIYLWSPERKCGARARVVFQHVWATGAVVEMGFEFLANVDFWDIDFANESQGTLADS